MSKILFRIAVILIASVTLPWAAISTASREACRAVVFVWLDIKVEWRTVCQTWKKGSFK